MWGNYGQPGVPGLMPMPPARTNSGLRITAVVLLVLVATLTLGGSFAPLLVYTSQYGAGGSLSTIRWTAWTAVEEPRSDTSYNQPLDGITLAVGIVLVVAAVVILLTTGRRIRVLGRSAGVGAAALLVGAIAQTMLQSLSTLRGQVRYSAQNPDSKLLWDMYFGGGAYLLIGAALCAVAAAVLLLISARSESPRPAGYAVRP